jgi:VWFA-related protein
MATMRRTLVAFLALAAMPAFAQTAHEALTVQYVEVPVTVVARDGNPVRGLTRANFELYDGKQRVDVSGFDAIDFASPASLLAQEKNPAARRTFLILFDLGYSSPRALERARDAARDFIQHNVQPRDLVGVGAIDQRRGYRLLANFSTDRSGTLAAIETPQSYHAADPLGLVDDAASAASSASSSAGTNNSRAAEAEAHLAAIARHQKQSNDQQVRQSILQQMVWLGQLSASMRSLHGRKQVVYLTEGFDPAMVRGAGARDVASTTKWAELVINGDWWKVGSGNEGNIDNDTQFGNTSSLAALQVMARAFRGSDVLLHAIDVQGVRTEDRTHGGASNSTDSLHMVADPTGGSVFENSNNLGEDFARMMRQQEVVYILGFQTPVRLPGKLHDLRVKLVSGPSGAVVHNRQAYFEGGAKESDVERVVNTAEILVKDIPQNDIHLASLAAAFPLPASAGAKAQVPVVVEIDGRDLLDRAAGTAVTADLFVYAFDDTGAVADRLFDRLTLDTEKAGAALHGSGIKYIATLALPPGHYAVKTLLRAADDRKGFSRSDVAVGAQAAVMPFLLDDPSAWLLIRGSDHSGAPYPFHVNGQPFVPSASGRLPAGTVRKLAVFVTDPAAGELTWDTMPAATLLAQVKGSGTTKLVLQLDDAAAADRFAVTVHREGAEALTASVPIARP